jgi:hypothetical protein
MGKSSKWGMFHIFFQLAMLKKNMEHIFLGTGVSEGNQENASWPWPSSHLKWMYNRFHQRL